MKFFAWHRSLTTVLLWVVFLFGLVGLFRQVFFSGCLHGDEQVGPTAVVEAAKLMVYGAVCDADPAAEVRLRLFFFCSVTGVGFVVWPVTKQKGRSMIDVGLFGIR